MTPTPSPALDRLLCFDLYAASRAVIKAYGPLLATLDLTYPQYLVMVVLWEGGPVTVGSLSERLSLDSGTLSPLLKRLEAAGFLRRVRRKEDERSVSLELTPEGQALQARALNVPGIVFCDFPLNPEECAGLQASLRRVRAAFAAPAP